MLVQGLGSVHFHWQPSYAGLADPMQGWQDFRRQVHGEDARTGVGVHVSHADLARHHHAESDGSTEVMALGSSDISQFGDAPAGASGALGQMIGPPGATALLLPVVMRDRWTVALAWHLETHQAAPLERPPRSA
ncbi:MAG: hypothetical protein H0W48_04545 [Methylibium sp.]|nr:hypothetical protein [Methylibium sp.]